MRWGRDGRVPAAAGVAKRRTGEKIPTPSRPHALTPHDPTTLVVNGDDFGYTDAINAAIVRCHDEGVLRSTSLLVNCRATRAALVLARSRPGLGVGLHVNLTTGVPVLPPDEVPTLVDRHGHFRSLGPQLRGLLRGRTNLDEVERELRAQFAILLDAGVRPTHVDGHLHAHAFPGVLDIVVRLMGEFGVPAMRSPLFGAWLTPSAERGLPGQSGVRPRLPIRAALLTRAMGVLTGPSMIRVVSRANADGPRAALLDRAMIARSRYLLDAARFLASPDPAVALAETVGALSGSMVEVMAHPAWNRDAARGAAETALLTDPRLPGMLEERGVRVGHF